MSVEYFETEGGLLNPRILNDGRNLICLQSNCVARKRHAGSLHDRLYEALGFGDPYKIRRGKECDWPQRNLARPVDRPELGCFLMQRARNDPESKCGLAFLFAQYNMGDGSRLYFKDGEYITACKKFESRPRKTRLEAFKECLKTLSSSSHTLKEIDRILFPMNIGCFRAGGHWPDYLKAINEFSKQVNVKVYIVKEK